MSGLFGFVSDAIAIVQRQAEIMSTPARHATAWGMAEELSATAGIPMREALARICVSISPGDEGLLDTREGAQVILAALKPPPAFCEGVNPMFRLDYEGRA